MKNSITQSRISPEKHRELLVKNWMTHDAMWFVHCLQECGIEKTNRINKAAVRSMALIEIKRITKALGMEKIESSEGLKSLMRGAWNLVGADFMKFTWSYPSDNVIRLDMRDCFAYEGVRKIGVADQYECGIFDRIEGWFEGLGLHYSVTPRLEGCLMRTMGRCSRDYSFSF